jgi:hypothetical protein
MQVCAVGQISEHIEPVALAVRQHQFTVIFCDGFAPSLSAGLSLADLSRRAVGIQSIESCVY